MKRFFIFLGVTVWIGAVAGATSFLVSKENAKALESANEYVANKEASAQIKPKTIYKKIIFSKQDTAANTQTDTQTETQSTPKPPVANHKQDRDDEDREEDDD